MWQESNQAKKNKPKMKVEDDKSNRFKPVKNKTYNRDINLDVETNNDGYKPRYNEGYKPRNNEGYKPRNNEGYRPRNNEETNNDGYKPRNNEGYRPRNNEETNNDGYKHRPRNNDGYNQKKNWSMENGYEQRHRNNSNYKGNNAFNFNKNDKNKNKYNKKDPETIEEIKSFLNSGKFINQNKREFLENKLKELEYQQSDEVQYPVIVPLTNQDELKLPSNNVWSKTNSSSVKSNEGVEKANEIAKKQFIANMNEQKARRLEILNEKKKVKEAQIKYENYEYYGGDFFEDDDECNEDTQFNNNKEDSDEYINSENSQDMEEDI